MEPTFPLKVVWGDGRRELFENRDDVAFNLEWFDTDDADDGTIVVDAEDRPVRLRVEALTILRLEVGTPSPSTVPRGSLQAHTT